jgi:hypothetical protein
VVPTAGGITFRDVLSFIQTAMTLGVLIGQVAK